MAALVLAQLGVRAHRMARAQTAADAAALAGALAGPGAARELATANGATLDGFVTAGPAVRVEATLDGAAAVAAATAPLGDVTPALAAALDRVADILGADAAASLRPLGPFGTRGVEASRFLAAELARLDHRTGLCRAGDGRPLHFVLCPAIPPQ